MSLSSRPYLLRGLYDWMTENNLTPQVLVNTKYRGVKVPESFTSDGQIVLNIAMTATKDLLLGDEQISFNARFSGRPHQIVLPIESVLAIFASEVDAGMSFGAEPSLSPADNKLLSASQSDDAELDGVAEDYIASIEKQLAEMIETSSETSDASSVDTAASDQSENVIHVQFGRDDADK